MVAQKKRHPFRGAAIQKMNTGKLIGRWTHINSDIYIWQVYTIHVAGMYYVYNKLLRSPVLPKCSFCYIIVHRDHRVPSNLEQGE